VSIAHVTIVGSPKEVTETPINRRSIDGISGQKQMSPTLADWALESGPRLVPRYPVATTPPKMLSVWLGAHFISNTLITLVNFSLPKASFAVSLAKYVPLATAVPFQVAVWKPASK
jgi:hypothetical protein